VRKRKEKGGSEKERYIASMRESEKERYREREKE